MHTSKGKILQWGKTTNSIGEENPRATMDSQLSKSFLYDITVKGQHSFGLHAHSIALWCRDEIDSIQINMSGK